MMSMAWKSQRNLRQTTLSVGHNLWQLLTEPAAPIRASENRRQARLLSLLLLATILATSLGFLVGAAPTLGASLGLMVAYAVSRTRHYHLAAALSLATLSAPPFAALVTSPDHSADNVFYMLIWLMLPLLLAGLVLTFRDTAVVAGFLLTGIVLVTLVVPDLKFVDIIGPVGYLGTAFLLVALSATIRQHYLRQLDRQLAQLRNARESLQNTRDELERRIDQQTDQAVELGQLNERMAAILNGSSDAIVLAGVDGTIHQSNSALDTAFGFQVDEVFGQALTSLVEPSHADTLTQVLHEVVHQRQSRRTEINALRKNGMTFPADAALSPITNRKGETWGIVCSIRDITERKQLEEDLRRALDQERELSELKSRFVSMVSHEFRTPLTVILSSSQMLKQYSDRMPEERKTAHLDKIETQVRRVTDLLNDVLTLNKADAVGIEFHPIPLSLETFCRDLSEELQLATNTSHQIVFSIGGHCAHFVADEKLLRQIISNLLTNAIKYSPQGGKVLLDVVCEDRQTIIRVQDEGMGIPDEDQARLFETFHRAKNVGSIPGTGLGLVIVQRAVQAHGGAITFDSKVGVGTTFTVVLPAQTSHK